MCTILFSLKQPIFERNITEYFWVTQIQKSGGSRLPLLNGSICLFLANLGFCHALFLLLRPSLQDLSLKRRVSEIDPLLLSLNQLCLLGFLNSTITVLNWLYITPAQLKKGHLICFSVRVLRTRKKGIYPDNLSCHGA